MWGGGCLRGGGDKGEADGEQHGSTREAADVAGTFQRAQNST